MKVLVICVCILVVASSNLVQTKQQWENADNQNEILTSIRICAGEHNVTNDDMYKVDDIMDNLYDKPENEERNQKIGCMLNCALKKMDLIEDSNINERKVHAKIDEKMEGNPMIGTAHRIARDCMEEIKNITQECKKGFSLYICVTKASPDEHKRYEKHEEQEHDEHEREETEETE